MFQRGGRYCLKIQQKNFLSTILNINKRLFTYFPIQFIRTISNTSRINAPKSGKGGGGKKKNEDVEVELPSTSEMTKSMEARITYLKDEFSKIRGGQVTPEMFNHIKINGYGSPMTLVQAGQISIKGGNKLVVNVFDPALLQFVTNSIRDCGMSLNPSVEGGAVVVSIPKSSAESRTEMTKLAAKASEKVNFNFLLIDIFFFIVIIFIVRLNKKFVRFVKLFLMKSRL